MTKEATTVADAAQPHSEQRLVGCVLSLFDLTGNMVKPWADAGYECICVDIQHHGSRTDGLVSYVGCDVMDYLPPLRRYAAVFAFPPCTHLSVSGARWFKGKGLKALSDSIALFHRAAQIAEWSGAPYMLENPVSTISSYWRKPDHTFQPWQYGDTWTKKTCLWVGNGFVMPKPLHDTPPNGTDNRIWKMAPSPERANLRAATPPNFARAVFAANSAIGISHEIERKES